MKQIDEWNAVYPIEGAPTNLVPGIRRALLSLEPCPAAVHFYAGEGLRWIRVGFGDALLAPSDVEVVGRAIQAGIDDPERTLYFHSLRSYDLLFFIEDFDPESTGMPPEYFGCALDKVLRAWWPAPSKAGRRKA